MLNSKLNKKLNKKFINKRFKTYLDTFLAKKGIDQERIIEIYDNDIIYVMTISVVLELIAGLNKEKRKIIKDKIVHINFVNRNIVNFLEYVARDI